MSLTFTTHLDARLRRREVRWRWRLYCGLLLLAPTFLWSAEKPRLPPPLPAFRQLPPLASVQAAAKAAKIPLSGIAPPLERTNLRVGDRVTALVSLTTGKKLEQWLITFTAVEPTEKEQQQPRGETPVFHSSSGNELRFETERAALAIQSIGPLSEADTGRKESLQPDIKRARSTVAEGFLALGLDRPPAMAERLAKRKKADPNYVSGDLQIGVKPFPREFVERARKSTEAAGITPADERALIGSLLALIEFFHIASKTKGLQEVVMSVIDVPWWSIIRSGGKIPGINFEMLSTDLSSDHSRLDAAPWLLPARTDVWAVPFVLHLNNKAALVCQLAVTTPRPPLLPCAGILGLAAGRPDGKGPVLTMQIVAAQEASPAAASVEPTSATP